MRAFWEKYAKTFVQGIIIFFAFLACIFTALILIIMTSTEQPMWHDDIITGYESMGESAYNSMSECLDFLPENLLKVMQDDGWQIIIAGDKTLNKLDPDFLLCSDIQGYTDYDEKLILISSSDPIVLLHEAGHVLDFYSGFMSDAFDVRAYFDELDVFLSKYPTDERNYGMINEYLAEAFAVMCLDNNWLEDACPYTYSYLQDMLEKLEI